jgi:signal transduction histidine kinase
MSGRRRWWRSIRFRATAGAVVVVGTALVAASAALLWSLRAGYVDRVRDPAELRAADIAESVGARSPIDELRLDEGPDRFVQLVRGGQVVGASDTAAGWPPLATGDVVGVSLPIGDPDDEWLVVTRDVGDTTVLVGRELDPPAESVRTATSALAVGVPLLLVVVGVTTWLVVGRALAPVEAIRAEVDEIGGSELDRRVPEPGGGDEVARLATTMNDMLDRLETADARQRRFVADASHELRSPIAAIRQQVEVARAHPDRTTVARLAEQVLGEDLRLQHLVDDLLVLARSDHRPTVAQGEVDLDDLLLVAAERARTGSSVVVDTTGIGAARVRGDEQTLARVVANLLDNALRHARSTVRLVSREDDQGTLVEVHDDGPGIPPSERARVMERFVRLDDARARDAGGVGLGLAIVDLVDAEHGGTVTIGDSPLGGALVNVRFPG